MPDDANAPGTQQGPGLQELDLDTCWAAIGARTIGRLAVSVGRQPDIFPVNYRVSDGKIVIRTAEGTKLAAAIGGGLVAFEIDHTDTDNHTGWSVVVHGTAAEPRSVEAVLFDEELGVEPWAGTHDKFRYIEITPTEITGRAIGGTVVNPTDPPRR